jgi:hypothetical protein
LRRARKFLQKPRQVRPRDVLFIRFLHIIVRSAPLQARQPSSENR